MLKLYGSMTSLITLSCEKENENNNNNDLMTSLIEYSTSELEGSLPGSAMEVSHSIDK